MRLTALLAVSLLLPAVWGAIVAWVVNKAWPRGGVPWWSYTGQRTRKAPVDYQI
jgi:hypothetical protein